MLAAAPTLCAPRLAARRPAAVAARRAGAPPPAGRGRLVVCAKKDGKKKDKDEGEAAEAPAARPAAAPVPAPTSGNGAEPKPAKVKASAQGSRSFDPTKPVPVKVSPEILTKVAERAQLEYIYEHALGQLQIELVKMQESIKAKGLKVAVLFEGRDAAGKGGCISRIASAMSPRVTRVVALSAPTEKEKSQWYFQRYVPHLPSAGELVLFDRSWYNRAGVEKVMGFCTDAQYETFMAEAPSFEKALTDSGTILIKLWLEVSDAEQERRFQDRLRRSWKRWKLSPMDLFARSRWTEYAKARDAMLKRTDSKHAPWWVLDGDNKQLAHLNCISHLLASVPYEDVPMPPLQLPPRESDEGYTPPPRTAWRFVPEVYSAQRLEVGPHALLQAATLEVAQLVDVEGGVPGPEN